MDPAHFPSRDQEYQRYLQHENNVNDPGYQKFVEPLVTVVQKYFKPMHLGLDYGAGPGPVSSHLLNGKGYQINLYDPFFHPDLHVLEKKYDYVICCEVIEHFHHPEQEFEKLKKLLKPNGKLFCMTEPYTSQIDFKAWHYKNDITHVIFYHSKTLEYLKNKFGFKTLEHTGRLVIFQNSI
jgi:SAM-dependent methyltransferase